MPRSIRHSPPNINNELFACATRLSVGTSGITGAYFCNKITCPSCYIRTINNEQAAVQRNFDRVLAPYAAGQTLLFLTVKTHQIYVDDAHVAVDRILSQWRDFQRNESIKKAVQGCHWRLEVKQIGDDVADVHIHAVLLMRPHHNKGKQGLNRKNFASICQSFFGSDFHVKTIKKTDSDPKKITPFLYISKPPFSLFSDRERGFFKRFLHSIGNKKMTALRGVTGALRGLFRRKDTEEPTGEIERVYVRKRGRFTHVYDSARGAIRRTKERTQARKKLAWHHARRLKSAPPRPFYVHTKTLFCVVIIVRMYILFMRRKVPEKENAHINVDTQNE